MAISDADFLAWLRSSAERTVLIEAEAWSGGGVVTRYMSNRGWVSAPTDTPANTVYEAVLLQVPGLRARMAEALSGRSVISYGDIEIDNASGELDGWINDAWDGRPLRIYIGAPSWPKSDFRQIFSGVTADIQVQGADVLVLRLRDRQQLLDKPAQTSTVGGTGSTAGQRIPICYGQCFNVEPMLVDAAARRYQVHDGAIQAITAVRSAGEVVNPANYTVDLATGTFTTAYAMNGQLTCDVQGSKTGGTYVSSTGDIWQRILTERGGIALADISTSSVAAVNTAAPGVVGLYLRDGSSTVLDALDSLAVGVGGYYTVDRSGKFVLAQFDVPGGTPVLTLGDDDYDAGAIDMPRRIVPVTKVRVGWDRNWTPSSSVSANVTDEATRARLRDEYRVRTVTTTAAASFLLAKEGEQAPTLFVSSADADAEAARRAAIFGVLRRVITLPVSLAAQQVRLGQVVGLDLGRFNLSGGVPGRVIGITESVTADKVELEIFV